MEEYIMVKRGEIYYIDFGSNFGSEQNGIRPAVILQNNTGNIYSPTTIVAPFTTRTKTKLPTHINIFFKNTNNTILLEQLKVIDKKRKKRKIGDLSNKKLDEINKALKISLDI